MDSGSNVEALRMRPDGEEFRLVLHRPLDKQTEYIYS